MKMNRDLLLLTSWEKTDESIQNFVSSLGNGIKIAEETNDIGKETSLKLSFEAIGGDEETTMSTS